MPSYQMPFSCDWAISIGIKQKQIIRKKIILFIDKCVENISICNDDFVAILVFNSHRSVWKYLNADESGEFLNSRIYFHWPANHQAWALVHFQGSSYSHLLRPKSSLVWLHVFVDIHNWRREKCQSSIRRDRHNFYKHIKSLLSNTLACDSR